MPTDRRNQIVRDSTVAHQVALRMDRRIRQHRVKSYSGYQVGPRGAQLKFDHQTIEVGCFGNLRRTHSA